MLHCCVNGIRVSHGRKSPISFCLNSARYMLFDHVHQVFGCALKVGAYTVLSWVCFLQKPCFVVCVVILQGWYSLPSFTRSIIISSTWSRLQTKTFPAPYSVSPLRLLLMSYAPIHSPTHLHLDSTSTPTTTSMHSCSMQFAIPFQAKKDIAYTGFIYVIALNSAFFCWRAMTTQNLMNTLNGW